MLNFKINWHQLTPIGPFVAILALGLGACTRPPHVDDVLEYVTTLKVEPRDVVQRIAISPDGKYVAVQGYSSKQIYIWRTNERSPAYRLSLYHGGGVNISPDGKYLYTSDSIPDRDHSLVVKGADGLYPPIQWRQRAPKEQFKGHRWSVETGEKLKTYYRANDAERGCTFYSMHFSPDGKQFITGSEKGLYLCDIETAKPIRFIPYPWIDEKGNPRKRDGGTSYLGEVKTFVMLADWKTALLAVRRHHLPSAEQWHWKDWAWEEMLLVWFDIQTGTIRREVTITPKLPVNYSAWSITVSPDGHLVTVNTEAILSSKRMTDEVEAYSKRQSLRIYDTRSGNLVNEIAVSHTRRSTIFSPDSKKLIAVGDRVSVWNISTGRKLDEFVDRSGDPRLLFEDIEMSADGRTVVSGLGDKIYVWTVTGSSVH